MGIFELLKWIWEQFEHYIWPWTIIHSYERGIRLTWGKNPKLVEPGLRFKFPFSQTILSENVMPNTMCPKAIHITTTDGKTVSVEPAIEYQVVDLISWVINVNDAFSNLNDITRGVVSDYLTDLTWDEVKNKRTQTEIKKRLNKRCEDMGCKITNVMLTDICLTRVIITQI